MNLMSKLTGIARSPGDPEVIQTGHGTKLISDHVARGLGWFSVGLGLAELIAPGRLARVLGMEGREGLLRAYGARELAAGRMSLSVNKASGAWSRVAGDVLDIGTLLVAYNSDNPKKRNVGIALAAVGAITLVDFVVAQTLTARKVRSGAEPRDFSNRSGFPQGVAAARGAAADFMKPDDMRAAPYRADASPLTGRTSVASERLAGRESINETGSDARH
jgi:hypothetical protein